MKIEINDELMLNIINDFKKKDISTAQKGEFIKQIMDDKNISQRECAKLLDVPYSTLHDWLTGRQMIKYYRNKKSGADMMNNILSSTEKDEIFTLSNRLIFLLSQPSEIKGKTLQELAKLREELNKMLP